jgi:hypothetical protein
MLRKIVNMESELLEEIKWKTLHDKCRNCRGSGEVNGAACCICRGSGGRKL